MAQSKSNLEKPLPQNVAAERAVLGAILLDNAALPTAIAKLKSGDFFVNANKIIFHEMIAMHEAGVAIDELTLTDSLGQRGTLALAEGVPYISSLADGLPRSTNVAAHALIVHQKAQLRYVIEQTQAIQEQAFGGLVTPDEVNVNLELLLKHATNGNGHRRRLQPVSLADFLMMDLKPASFVIDPILPVQGLMLLYCWRGGGKTYFVLEIAAAIATGPSRCFPWTIPEARRVLYVDGEMPANEMQERLKNIITGRGTKMPLDKRMFELLTPDLIDDCTLNIVTSEGQRLIEDHLQGGDILILDNLSALGHVEGKGESESESWWPVQEWALRLRKKGISVIFIHHAGKSGGQRGTSSREDLMHTVLAMRRPTDYQQSEGLRAEIHFEKMRRYKGAEGIYPFEVKLETDHRGAAMWTQRPLKDIVDQQVAQMLDAGMKPSEIADELKISRFTVYRMKKKQSVL